MIYTITFSPSIEYFVKLDGFKEGAINKSVSGSIDVGGKGINITKVLTNLGVNNTALGFVGGHIGDEIELKMFEGGYSFDFVRCGGGSRINVNMDNQGKYTTIRGVGVDIDDQAIDQLLQKLEKVDRNDYAVIAGYAPDSVDISRFERIVKFLTLKGVSVVLEVNATILPALLKYNPYLVKITQNELKKITGARSVTFQEAEQGGQKIQKLGARNVLVFMSTGGAVLVNSKREVYSSHCPVVKGSLYGANEAFTAGFLSSIISGESYEDAMAFATSARLASVLNRRLAGLDEINECLDKVRVEFIKKERDLSGVRNIVLYAKEVASTPFKQKPINALDLAILTQLLYLDFGAIGEKGVTLREEFASYLEKYPNKYTKLGLILPQFYPLLEICATSQRFSEIVLKNREFITDEDMVVQFAGITYKIPTGESVVAFKGTDDTIVGWKEDFYMLFDKPIESQLLAVQYLNKHFDKRARKADLYVVGHSKGGNLALYGVTNACENVRKRLHSVINFDGPGFSREFYSSDNYKQIRDKAYEILPQLSVIGRLFYHEEKSVVVKSCYVGGYQHDLLSWETSGDNFSVIEKLDGLSDKVENKINSICSKLNATQRQIFVEGLFSLLYSTNSSTLTELIKNRSKLISGYLKSDQNTKMILFKTFVELGTDKHVRQLFMITLGEVRIMQRQKRLEIRAIEEGNIDKAINVFKTIGIKDSDERENSKKKE